MLRVRNLKCYYGKIRAINGVSLSVRPGELIALIGANGAGKSTLLQAVCGLISQWEGEIELEKHSLRGLKAPTIVERGLSLVPEGRLLFPPMSVLDNLRLGAYLRYRRREQRVLIAEDLERVMALFPVLQERAVQPAGTLSGGEQQMLAIGRAFMSDPKLLCIDEPSTGLAPLIRQEVFDKISEISRLGITILLVEQEVGSVFQMAHRNYVLSSGKIIAQGTGRQLLADEVLRKTYLGL